jgi:hypothetical protein
MEISVARAVITQARKDNTYAGPMPEDDATCLKEAENLVEMAEQAWTQQIRGPEVEAILNLANQAPQNGDQNGGVENESGDQDDSEAESDAPKIEFSDALTKLEPWDGYGDMTVADVTEGVNWYIEEKPEDLADLLTHVYAFEQSHKNRSRILKHITQALDQLGVKIGKVEDAGTGEADDSDSTESEADGQGAPEADAEGDQSSGDQGSGDDEPTKAEGKSDKGKSDAKSETPPQGAEGGSGEHEAEPLAENQGGGSDDGGSGGSGSAYRKLIDRVTEDLRNERLDGIPKPPSEEAPELPWNWADISDSTLHDYHMQYASLAYYASYMSVRNERVAMLCREAADEVRNALLVELPKYDEKNKEIKVTVLEAKIESDDRVRRWRKLQRKHEQMALQAKREMESYHKLVEALSRLETMRHNSWERARR